MPANAKAVDFFQAVKSVYGYAHKPCVKRTLIASAFIGLSEPNILQYLARSDFWGFEDAFNLGTKARKKPRFPAPSSAAAVYSRHSFRKDYNQFR
jgi:hypothetical protein